MTTFNRERCKCSVCGAVSQYNVLTSSNTFGGSQDLDTRPPEMMRSTMGMWIQECPKCGYISRRVSDLSLATRDWLKSGDYRTCGGIHFTSDLAKQFYKYYMISIKDENMEDAFFNLLHAAWACDDANDSERAKHCREIAIPILETLIETDSRKRDVFLVMKADLMRRAGQFDALIEEFSSIHFDHELHNKILEYEIEKAKSGDTACYRVSDVTDGTGT